MRSFFALMYTSLIGVLIGLQIFLFLRGPGSHVIPSSHEQTQQELPSYWNINDEEDPAAGQNQQQSLQMEKMKFIVSSPGCRIMDIDPFSPDVLVPYKRNITRKDCTETRSGYKARVSDDGILSLEKLNNQTDYSNCCYKEIFRMEAKVANHFTDWLINTTNQCQPIPPQGVQVNASFIQYECQCQNCSQSSTTDFLARVLPPELQSEETKAKVKYWKDKRTKPPNVLLLNINSISRLHMFRNLNKTREFALSNDFLELKGYTKTGESLFSNFMSMTAGLYDNKYSCWAAVNKELDSCPFIWKDFSREKYVTGLVEDAPYISIFNYNKAGFLKQPVDYYLRPLMVAAHKYYNVRQTYSQVLSECLNGETLVDSLIKYLEDFLRQVAQKIPYFMLASFKSYNGMNLNLIHMEDKYFEKLLSDLITNPLYDGNNTIIVLFSTHGDTNVEENFQTTYEQSLPMMLIRLPPTMKQSHPNWYTNLTINTEKLTTPFDLHATLNQVIHPDISEVKVSNGTTQGYSVFGNIPDRTCTTAGIAGKYCRCGWIPAVIAGSGISSESQFSAELGQILLDEMNSILQPVIRKPLCEPLALKDVLYVQVLREGYLEELPSGRRTNFIDFFIGIEVDPSNAKFEGVVREYANLTKALQGNVIKTSPTGEENYCVNDAKYKRYCSCFEHNLRKRIDKFKLLMRKSGGFHV